MSPTMCPDDFDQLGNKLDTQDRGIIHRGQWSVVVDSLAVDAAPVPPLLHAGVKGSVHSFDNSPLGSILPLTARSVRLSIPADKP
jgi:hypothetical protein